MKFKFLLIFILITYPHITFGQNILKLGIKELFSLGIEHSLVLKISSIEEEMTRDEQQNVKSEQLPDISIGGSIGYGGIAKIYPQSEANKFDWSHNYDVQIIQPIYQGGKIRAEIEKSSLENKKALLRNSNNEAEIKILLLKQYMDLILLYKQSDVIERNIEQAQHRLKEISRLRQQGLVVRNDEIRSELQLTNYQLAKNETNNNISIVSQQLDVVLGLDESLLIVPDTTILNTVIDLKSYDEFLSAAYSHDPSLDIANTNTQIATTDLKSVRSGYIPWITFSAGDILSYPISLSSDNRFLNNWNLSLSIKYNLSSLYHLKNRLNKTKHNISLNKIKEEQVMQNIRIALRSAYLRHLEAVDRIKMLKLSVIQANENYRIVENRYINQLATITELLDASSVRIESELQLTNAQSQVVYTYYEIQRVCGIL